MLNKIKYIFIISALFLLNIGIYYFADDFFSQDKYSYYRNWYLYPKFLYESIFYDSIDFILRFILYYIFPTNLDIRDFSILFSSFIFFYISIFLIFINKQINSNKSTLVFVTVSLLFLFTDRLSYDFIHNATRTGMATFVLVLYFFSRNIYLKVALLLLSIITHFGLTVLFLIMLLLFHLIKLLKINLKYFYFFALFYFILDFIIGIKLLLGLNYFFFGDFYQPQILRTVHFLGHQNLLRGLTISSNITFNQLLQFIFFLLPYFVCNFINVDKKYNLRFINFIFFLTIFLIGDFWLVYRITLFVGIVGFILLIIHKPDIAKKIIYFKIIVFIIVFLRLVFFTYY